MRHYSEIRGHDKLTSRYSNRRHIRKINRLCIEQIIEHADNYCNCLLVCRGSQFLSNAAILYFGSSRVKYNNNVYFPALYFNRLFCMDVINQPVKK